MIADRHYTSRFTNRYGEEPICCILLARYSSNAIEADSSSGLPEPSASFIPLEEDAWRLHSICSCIVLRLEIMSSRL